VSTLRIAAWIELREGVLDTADPVPAEDSEEKREIDGRGVTWRGSESSCV
jgi:hypothetical protein